MTHALRSLVLIAAVAAPLAAAAQPYRGAPLRDPDTTGSLYRLTPPEPYGYDTNGDMDKHPELAPYQQGGGQQTGGPARNRIPGDTLHIAPR